MKKLICGLLALLCALGCAWAEEAAPETFTAGDYRYRVREDGTVLILRYTGKETHLTIPDTLDGRPVTMIAGFFVKTLQSVTIPEGVIVIGPSAFGVCTALERVTLPKGLTTIDVCAFSGCTALEHITLPEGLTTIGDGAFYGCTALERITLPEGLTTIDGRAFYGCTALERITLPEGLTTIGDGAFYGCTALERVTIPEGVTSIGDRTFDGCTALERITVPRDSYAAQYCEEYELPYAYAGLFDGLPDWLVP